MTDDKDVGVVWELTVYLVDLRGRRRIFTSQGQVASFLKREAVNWLKLMGKGKKKDALLTGTLEDLITAFQKRHTSCNVWERTLRFDLGSARPSEDQSPIHDQKPNDSLIANS